MKHLDLSICDLRDDFLVQLTSGQWPLLQILDLSQNSLSLQGVAQLVAGHWPNLSVLDLQYNNFDMSDSDLEQRESFAKSIKAKWPTAQLWVTNEYNDDDLSESS